MMDGIPTAGAATAELQQQAQLWWLDAARRAGIDIGRFPGSGTLDEQLSWAKSHDLTIGTTLARFSWKMQHSTDAQVKENVEGAALRKIFVPGHFICVDEGVTGRKMRRDGLDRAKALLASGAVGVILVYKASRLFRVGYRGYQFIQEEVVDEGLRAICVSQGIDTDEKTIWKLQLTFHGLSDEMLLTTTADHVRSGLKALFAQGYVVGALTAGYRGKEVPNARPTNLGRPRRMPVVDKEGASHILTAMFDVLGGMPISRAWRKYRAAGGPVDPRSRKPDISYSAFRRMLANRRYTGRWAFGRQRNVWSNKRDGNRPQTQPDTEVVIVQLEELRIIDDAPFEAVQAILARNKLGPRGPKRARSQLHLGDFIAEVLVCKECQERFYQAGANGDGMRCKNGSCCPANAIIDRKATATIICREFARLLCCHQNLLREVATKAAEQDLSDSDDLEPRIEDLTRRLARNKNRLNDLIELSGEGTDEDRALLKAKIRATQIESKAITAERATLEAYKLSRKKVQPHEANAILSELESLFGQAATGELGDDAVYRLLKVIKSLSQGKITVEALNRPGRTRKLVMASFHFQRDRLVETVLGTPSSSLGYEEVRFWVRPPPPQDRIAERMHDLIDLQGMTTNEAVEALHRDGDKVRFNYAWQCYQRYYEMHNLPAPKRPYNNGKQRRASSTVRVPD